MPFCEPLEFVTSVHLTINVPFMKSEHVEHVGMDSMVYFVTSKIVRYMQLEIFYHGMSQAEMVYILYIGTMYAV
jgi:hypothetical protein